MSYPQRPQVSFQLELTPVVKRIIIANMAIWLVFLIGVRWVHVEGLAFLYEHLALHPAWGDPASLLRGELWQLLTYMWLHDLTDPTHVLFNMLLLWMFGGMFERRWGGRAFFNFYVLCGAGAAAVTALAALLSRSLFGNPVVGASGAVLAFLAAFALTFPDRKIFLWFVLPIAGKHILTLTVALDVLFFIARPTSFAFATHIGGILTGVLLVTGLWRPRRLLAKMGMARRARGPRRPNLRVLRRDDDEERGPWLH